MLCSFQGFSDPRTEFSDLSQKSSSHHRSDSLNACKGSADSRSNENSTCPVTELIRHADYFRLARYSAAIRILGGPPRTRLFREVLSKYSIMHQHERSHSNQGFGAGLAIRHQS